VFSAVAEIAFVTAGKTINEPLFKKKHSVLIGTNMIRL
jgi:hypothetical protein